MLCFRIVLVAKKLMDKTEGSIDFFSRIFFVTVPKKIVGVHFRVSLIRVSKNIMIKRVLS